MFLVYDPAVLIHFAFGQLDILLSTIAPLSILASTLLLSERHWWLSLRRYNGCNENLTVYFHGDCFYIGTNFPLQLKYLKNTSKYLWNKATFMKIFIQVFIKTIFYKFVYLNTFFRWYPALYLEKICEFMVQISAINYNIIHHIHKQIKKYLTSVMSKNF